MQKEHYNAEYVRRIHKVQDYIETHLNEVIFLDELACEAGFSKYHFSRIFQSIVKETLAHYVNRIRMEQALFLLAHRQDKNMTDIAYEMGFTDSAIFSRAFKNYYGISPREYRSTYRKLNKQPFVLSSYKMNGKVRENRVSEVKGEVTIENLQEKQAIYVRHIGTYDSLAHEYSKLMNNLWAHAYKQQLIVEGQNWVLAMYHDNPEFGEETQFRTSLCITIPNDKIVEEDDVVEKMTIEGGLYAVGHFRIKPDEYGDIWDYMYEKWLMCSEYLPRNACPFEVYRKVPEEGAPEGDLFHEVDIYVPIEPL